MTPENVGIATLATLGVACIALSIFMMRWEEKRQRDQISGFNGRDVHPTDLMAPGAPDVEPKEIHR